MEQQLEIPEHDSIDEALLGLLHQIVGEEAEEEELDAASNVLFSLMEQLVDEAEIEEAPETDGPEEAKERWIAECLPILSRALSELIAELSDNAAMSGAWDEEEIDSFSVEEEE